MVENKTLLLASILPLAAQQTATVNGTLIIFKDQFVVKMSEAVKVEDDMQGKVSSNPSPNSSGTTDQMFPG